MQNPLIKKNSKIAYPKKGVGMESQAMAFAKAEYSPG
jgi:hypothetical protein